MASLTTTKTSKRKASLDMNTTTKRQALDDTTELEAAKATMTAYFRSKLRHMRRKEKELKEDLEDKLRAYKEQEAVINAKIKKYNKRVDPNVYHEALFRKRLADQRKALYLPVQEAQARLSSLQKQRRFYKVSIWMTMSG